MKTIYLIRHGIAVERGERGAASDADRMLTAEGRKKTDLVARGLRRLGILPDRIVCSPLVRAVETAALLTRRVAPRLRIEQQSALAPETPARQAAAWLAGQRFTSIFLVGHLPQLADLAALLLGGDSPVQFTLKKASVCCLTFSGPVRPGRGCLEWLLQPGHFFPFRS